MVLVSQEAGTVSPKDYTDKQVSMLRAMLNDHVVTREAQSCKIKQLEDQLRISRLEYDILNSEVKALKQEIHNIKSNQKSKQLFLEEF